MDLVHLWLFLAGLVVILYVVLDGFSLGVGLLFPTARNEAERDVMMNSIAPVWDANQTWLVFGGGALFTMSGRAAGVLYLNLNEIARSSLAVPTDCYRDHAEELLRYGQVVSRPKRAWLGMFAHALEEGVIVAGIVPGGPGDKGGLREGDLIVSLDAQEVSSRRELYMSLWRHEPGEQITLEVMRDNAVRRLELTGGDRAEFFKQV